MEIARSNQSPPQDVVAQARHLRSVTDLQAPPFSVGAVKMAALDHAKRYQDLYRAAQTNLNESLGVSSSLGKSTATAHQGLFCLSNNNKSYINNSRHQKRQIE